MESDLVQAVAEYAESVMGAEGFRYISAVVATCKMLALEVERASNTEALVIAAYLHNISTIEFGFQDHHVKSAEMAVAFLREHQAQDELIASVEKILLAHAMSLPADERESQPLEARVLYDA